MRIVDKPWGHETIWAETDKYAGKLLTINAGHKLSRQYHEFKEETIYVLEGRLVLETGHAPHQTLILEAGSTYHVKPGHIHRFAAPSEGCTLIEVSTPELEDVVRLEDEYDRS